MGRVLSNDVALNFGIQNPNTLETAPASWKSLEPNSLGAIGATISTIVRNPISKSRQRKKGTITDLDSSVEFEHDVTYDGLYDLVPGFMFARGSVYSLERVPVTALTATAASVAVSGFVAAQRGYIAAGSLFWGYDFVVAGNNGLKVAAGTPAANATAITFAAASFTAGAAATGFLSFCGYRNSTTPGFAIAAGVATLTENGLGTALIARGLKAGQLVHIGSIASLGGAVQNGIGSNSGFARVRTIAANTVTLDKIPTTWAAVAAGSDDVDFIFGDYIKSEDTGAALHAELPHWFEVEHPNLDDAGNNEFIHAKGNYCNTLGFNLPLTDKATMSLAYIGTDTDPPAARRSVAANVVNPVLTEAFNTTSDIARLRIQELDYSGITTDFKSLTLTINNNVSAEKVLQRLGARYMNTGEFAVSIESQVIFTSGQVIAAIRSNETVSMDFILKNNDGVIGVDIPGMTLGGGNRDYPENESVLINTTAETFEDELFKSSLSFNFIPVPIA